MTEIEILRAEPSEFDEIRGFYHTLIDEMAGAPYPPSRTDFLLYEYPLAVCGRI